MDGSAAIYAQLLVDGVLLGGVYALVSTGLTVIFGVLRVVNFAHGEFLMVAMYAGFALLTIAHVPLFVAVLATAILLYAFGWFVEATLVRRTIGKPELVQVFATVGLSVVLQSVALMTLKADVRVVNLPFVTRTFALGPLSVSQPRLTAFAAAIVVTAALLWYLRATDAGRAIRATAQDRQAAALMGIDVPKVYRLTFALGSALTGIAGALIVPMYAATPTVGEEFALVAFVVVVLGGLGSVTGAVAGGIVIGVVETVSGFFIDPQWKQAVYFAVFLLLLVMRPSGLFGIAGSERYRGT